MVDWNGLLKYTLTMKDGTKNSDFKEMDKETQKWLEEAMEDYTFNEIKRCHEIFVELE